MNFSKYEKVFSRKRSVFFSNKWISQDEKVCSLRRISSSPRVSKLKSPSQNKLTTKKERSYHFSVCFEKWRKSSQVFLLRILLSSFSPENFVLKFISIWILLSILFKSENVLKFVHVWMIALRGILCSILHAKIKSSMK